MKDLWYRFGCGVVLCLAVHYGKMQWDWTRSAMYGLSVIGLMYVTAGVMGLIKKGSGNP